MLKCFARTRVLTATILVLALTSFSCTYATEEETLESSDDFLSSLEPSPELGDSEPVVGATEENAPVEDFAIAKDYESFDPSDIRIKFEFDSAELTTQNTEALLKISAGLKKDPLAKIFVRGHADKQGPEGYNDYLSKKRAKVIFNFLTEQGIDENRLIVIPPR